ncbi:hypothetical protein AVEN_113465-1 [Araneus ventricosus]|uniref:Uncharacterized protein n=1 Tax=Araneus ventricosus TaxID=182803 RepID=A0A4Y2H005_ARAVE|nr:hypothetical protein AVEN_255630-1 [Araneus ventricosus]GBM58089.1 hypothetical protein AVEN_113465-1 [Araneus ventricosus]
MGRYRCIDDHMLCDGFIDCAAAEDEDRMSCMFYKTVTPLFSTTRILTCIFLAAKVSFSFKQGFTRGQYCLDNKFTHVRKKDQERAGSRSGMRRKDNACSE